MRKAVGVVMLGALTFMFVGASATAGPSIKAKPTEFIGTVDSCGVAGTDTITAAWKTKSGLPDSAKSDHALLLQKLGATTNCAAAFAVIRGAEGQPVTSLGFDYKDGTHCTNGSVRFNLEASDGFHFVGGCAHGDVTGTMVDRRGATWKRVNFNLATDAFPPVTPGATIVSLALVMDEGEDSATPGAGTAWVDNINVNGVLIGKP